MPTTSRDTQRQNAGYLGMNFAEHVEVLEAIAWRDRVECDGGEL